ncbi:VWA domain-containing protein [Streptomyces telluris]|uniref:VWA domain-containing protein n=1 Tax=Streptomyces telluris TaxID=2720021 RepID=A0A9X2LKS6_9ACTN|nr:vWA domain-containing protein [Streptomyces telluris]MCQ8772968.1 VWA domain-containing protein [Streptomyces telluris]NJP78316.1 VWA domain-containing protein [Streptomyces telluris]
MNRDDGAGPQDRAPTAALPALTAQLGQNKHLPAGSGTVPAHAVLTVEGHGLGGLTTHASSAEVVVIDCSGSMSWPSTKISAARKAAAAAIGVLRDGTRFALVEGTDKARVVYPAGGRMAVAGPDTRADAARTAHGLVAAGGTAIASWLACARDLLTAPGQDHPIRHALLLTDGRNEHDRPDELERVLADCAGKFTCDARGIGDQWAAAELRAIAARLHGKADAVERDSDLEEEFRTMMTSAMTKALPGIRIRVRLRVGSELRFFKQVFPTELDLTAEAVQTGERSWDFPTGAWGDESRDYHLCVTADPAGDPMGEDMQLASLSLVADAVGDHPAEAVVAVPRPVPLLVHWTDDAALSTRVHPRVAHFAGHADLGRAVNAGCEAYERGGRATAEEEWGRAVRLADDLGDEKMLRRLRRLVHVDDAREGRVRLRDVIAAGDLHAAWVGSDHSTQAQASWAAPPGPPAPPPSVHGQRRAPGAAQVAAAPAARAPGTSGGSGAAARPDVQCPRCGRVSPGTAQVCSQCRYRLADPAPPERHPRAEHERPEHERPEHEPPEPAA